jgi:hypothetical protein
MRVAHLVLGDRGRPAPHLHALFGAARIFQLNVHAAGWARAVHRIDVPVAQCAIRARFVTVTKLALNAMRVPLAFTVCGGHVEQ